MMKYMTRMGQNTGTLNTSNRVHENAIRVARVAHHQNYIEIYFKYFLEFILMHLKLGQPPDKGLKLGIARRWQRTSIILVLVIVRLGLDFWRQEGDEQIQIINMERIGDDVESLEHP